MKIKLLTSCLSALLVCMISTFMHLQNMPKDYTGVRTGYFETFLGFLLIFSLYYFVICLPFSIVIDRLVESSPFKRRIQRYALMFVLYSLLGGVFAILSAILWIGSIAQGISIYFFHISGVGAVLAMVYFHLFILLRRKI